MRPRDSLAALFVTTPKRNDIQMLGVAAAESLGRRNPMLGSSIGREPAEVGGYCPLRLAT